jgi:hypothetical protein
VLRELQAAGVPYRAAICARLLHSVGHWCLAMGHHGAPDVLLPLYHLPHTCGRAGHQPHQSSLPSYNLVPGPNPLLIISSHARLPESGIKVSS